MKRILGISDSYKKLENYIKKIEERIKKSFSLVKEEFEEHLDSINENTNEIQHNAEQIYELIKRVDRLTQRIDEIELAMSQGALSQTDKKYDVPDFTELTNIEREVFLFLYSMKEPVQYNKLSQKLAISDESVRKSIVGLISKGIPIVKRYVKNTIFIEIDPGFKLQQKNHNLMSIDEQLVVS